MGELESSKTRGAECEDAPLAGCAIPEDFSAEEALFAAEVRALFPLDQDEGPPRYAQTLMEAEERGPLAPGFEEKTMHSVFSRLGLPSPSLVPPAEPVWARVAHSARRPFAGVVGVLLVLMAISVVVTGPAFAQGLRLLLTHSGVQQVQHYPQTVSHVERRSDSTPAVPTLDPAQPLYWLGPSFAKYEYQGMRLEAERVWSQGPVVDIQYVLPGATAGSGLLDIRQFRVAPTYAAVLQVVQTGSAQEARVGNAPAVYVDGRWIHRTARGSYDWQPGISSMLIFERDGVVFWVTADQRDGMRLTELVNAMSKLELTSPRALQPSLLTVRSVGRELAGTLANPVRNEAYALLPKGTSLASGLALFVQTDGAAGAP